MNNTKRTWVEINLDALRHNMQIIRNFTAPSAQIMAVVKADAYGHGVNEIADTLLKCGATWLAVSMLDINDGNVKTTLAFYNYGSVGQNEIDNCVGAISFADMVIPEMEFVSSEKMIAFGDTETVIFEGTQKPQMTEEVSLGVQAKSIFYNKNYFRYRILCHNVGDAPYQQIYFRHCHASFSHHHDA